MLQQVTRLTEYPCGADTLNFVVRSTEYEYLTFHTCTGTLPFNQIRAILAWMFIPDCSRWLGSILRQQSDIPHLSLSLSPIVYSVLLNQCHFTNFRHCTEYRSFHLAESTVPSSSHCIPFNHFVTRPRRVDNRIPLPEESQSLLCLNNNTDFSNLCRRIASASPTPVAHHAAQKTSVAPKYRRTSRSPFRRGC